jgi:hypothetical protein
MKAEGEVLKLEDGGEGVLITVGNVRNKSDAEWRGYYPSGITMRLPHAKAKSYFIGRKVIINFHPQ